LSTLPTLTRAMTERASSPGAAKALPTTVTSARGLYGTMSLAE
jgi:hypothetical protein